MESLIWGPVTRQIGDSPAAQSSPRKPGGSVVSTHTRRRGKRDKRSDGLSPAAPKGSAAQVGLTGAERDGEDDGDGVSDGGSAGVGGTDRRYRYEHFVEDDDESHRLLHQRHLDVFDRQQLSQRRKNMASRGSVRTRKKSVPSIGVVESHAADVIRNATSSNAGTHLEAMLLNLRRNDIKESLRPWITHHRLFPGRVDPRKAPIRMEEMKLLAKTWWLHRVYPSGPREFWKANADPVIMAILLAEHAVGLGPAPDMPLSVSQRAARRRSRSPSLRRSSTHHIAPELPSFPLSSTGAVATAGSATNGSVSASELRHRRASVASRASYKSQRSPPRRLSKLRGRDRGGGGGGGGGGGRGGPGKSKSPRQGGRGGDRRGDRGGPALWGSPKGVRWGNVDVQADAESDAGPQYPQLEAPPAGIVFRADPVSSNVYISRMTQPGLASSWAPRLSRETTGVDSPFSSQRRGTPPPGAARLDTSLSPSPGGKQGPASPMSILKRHMHKRIGGGASHGGGAGAGAGAGGGGGDGSKPKLSASKVPGFKNLATALVSIARVKNLAASSYGNPPPAPPKPMPMRIDTEAPIMSQELLTSSRTKRRCAASLRNLSVYAGSELPMMEQGALTALFGLIVTNDRETQRHVAAALYNLTCEPAVRVALIDGNVVTALLALLDVQDDSIRLDSADALGNLVCERYADMPFIHDGPLGTIIRAALQDSISDEVRRHFTRVLFNLATSRENHARLVNKDVPKVLVMALGSGDEFVWRLGLLSMVFMSCFVTPRSRLLSEGAVPALTALSARIHDESAAQQLSLVLEHLASDEAALKAIVDEGCVQALVNIAALGSEATTISCGSAIAELAMRPVCFERVVGDNGIASIVSLAYSDDATMREKSALALCNLSTYGPARAELLKADAVAALVAISGNGTTLSRRICSVALCNLVQDLDDLTRVEVERRAVGALADLAMQDAPPGMTSLAAGGGEDGVGVGAGAGVGDGTAVGDATTADQTDAMLLATLPDDDSQTGDSFADGQAQCGRALAELSLRPRLRPVMVQSRVLEAVAAMLRHANASLAEDCLRTLSQLAKTPSLRLALAGPDARFPILKVLSVADLSVGPAIPPLVAEALRDVARHPDCIVPLVTGGVMALVAKLRRVPDTVTRLHTARLLLSLVARPSVREPVFHAGGVAALVSCAQADGEDVKRTACQALQLLTLYPDVDGRSLKEGAVVTLMVILVFRSDDIATKYACCKALFNLIANKSCRAPMIEAGVLWAMVKAAKASRSETLMKISALVVSNVFCYQSLVQLVLDNKGLVALTDLAAAHNPVTTLWCSMALRQLSWQPRLLERLVLDGVIPPLVHLALTSRGKTQQECAEALAHLSCCDEGRHALLEARGSKAVAALCLDRTEHIMYSCAVILNNLSALPPVHEQLVEDGLLHTLAVLATASYTHTLRLVGRTLHNVSSVPEHRVRMLKDVMPSRPPTAPRTEPADDDDTLSLMTGASGRGGREGGGGGSAMGAGVGGAGVGAGSGSATPLTGTSRANTANGNPRSSRPPSGAASTATSTCNSEEMDEVMPLERGPAKVTIPATAQAQLQMLISKMAQAKAQETRGWCLSALANLSWEAECRLLLTRAGAVRSAYTHRLAGSGKVVRRHLAVIICNLSAHPDTLDTLLQDGVVSVAVQMVKAQRDVGNIVESWAGASKKLMPPMAVQAKRKQGLMGPPTLGGRGRGRGGAGAGAGAGRGGGGGLRGASFTGGFPRATPPSIGASRRGGRAGAASFRLPVQQRKISQGSFRSINGITGGSFRGIPDAATLKKRPKLITSEDLTGPGRDIVVDYLLARTFRNLMANLTTIASVIKDTEIIPGLFDLADAVTDIALGNADGTDDRSFRFLRQRQRDFSAVQDCATAFANITWHPDSHERLLEDRVVEILLIMTKLDDAVVHSQVTIALCNLSHTASIVDRLVDLHVVGTLIDLATKSDSDDTRRRCAAALDNLSCNAEVQAAVMEEKVVLALVKLVRTRDHKALLESPHHSLPARLAAPKKLVPQSLLLQPLPPLPPRGENFDDSSSNKMIDQAFSRSARNLMAITSSTALSDEGDLAMALPANSYDEHGNFKLDSFPRSLQPQWDPEEVQNQHLFSLERLQTPEPADVDEHGEDEAAQPVTLADHISKRAAAHRIDDEEHWARAVDRFPCERLYTDNRRPIIDTTDDNFGTERVMLKQKHGMLIDQETPLLETLENLLASPHSESRSPKESTNLRSPLAQMEKWTSFRQSEVVEPDGQPQRTPSRGSAVTPPLVSTTGDTPPGGASGSDDGDDVGDSPRGSRLPASSPIHTLPPPKQPSARELAPASSVRTVMEAEAEAGAGAGQNQASVPLRPVSPASPPPIAPSPRTAKQRQASGMANVRRPPALSLVASPIAGVAGSPSPPAGSSTSKSINRPRPSRLEALVTADSAAGGPRPKSTSSQVSERLAELAEPKHLATAKAKESQARAAEAAASSARRRVVVVKRIG